MAGQPFPNFFIVGAAKSGTTSLFAALARHGDIFCCPIKEPNYFAFDFAADGDVIKDARRQGLLIDRCFTTILEPPRVGITVDYAAYLDLFREARGQRAVGEASTTYLPSRVAAREIACRFPDARIIIVLRNPIARTYSDYLMGVQIGFNLGTFREAVECELNEIVHGNAGVRGVVSSSFYALQVRRYLEHFPRDQILFLLFEELVASPQRTLRRVFRHLRVDPHAAGGIRFGWENQSRTPRVPWLNQLLLTTGMKWILLRAVPRPVRQWLRCLFYTAAGPAPLSPCDHDMLLALFRNDIAETATLISRDLTLWMQPPSSMVADT